MNRKHPHIVLLSCLLVIMACSLPQAAGPTPMNAIDTLVAQTAAARGGANPTATLSASPTPTVFVTPLPQPVLLTVSLATNCRTGPGKEYDMLDILNVGETAEAVGRYVPANYWIIKKPHGAGLCWLWGEYVAIVSGDALLLPEMTPPPSPTPQPLAVVSVRAFVPSDPWQGTCPHTFHVWAEITLSGEGSDTLHYRWRRSDGFVGPQHTLEVSAGTYTVEGEWKVTQDGSYRIQIEILSPTGLTSEWSAFHEVDCR